MSFAINALNAYSGISSMEELLMLEPYLREDKS